MPSPHRLVQLARNIRELALLELCLPENGIRVVEAMLDPAILLDVVQVDEATRVRVTMGGGQDTPSAELKRVLVREIELVFCIEHTVGERLARADAEEVARETRAVAVDVVERRAFLGGNAGTHGPLGLLESG
jgi:hypothetical protein